MATPNWQAVLNWANNGNPIPPCRVEKSDDAWQAELTTEQYYVTREKGTERAFSSGMCSLLAGPVSLRMLRYAFI